MKSPGSLALVALFALYRIGALLSWRPGGYVVDWTERYFFAGWLRYVDAGYFPIVDFWMEYPPLLPLFGVVSYWLAQWLPPWRDPTLWFSLTTGLPLLLIDVGSLLLVIAIARLINRGTAWLAGALWAVGLVPLYYWLSGFDGPAVFAILLVVWLAARSRRDWKPALVAGIAIGLGAQYKVIPAVVGPAALLAFWYWRRRSAVIFFSTAGLTATLIALPFAVANLKMFTASYASILARSSWETVWALLDGYHGGGLVAPIETRFDAAVAYLPQHESRLPWAVIALGAVGMLGWLLTRRHDWRNPRSVVTLSFLSVIVFLLAAKGWSTQFLVYPLPFIFILWPNLRGAGYAALLSAVNFLEWPFWLSMFGEHDGILTFLILFRTTLLLALGIECWLVLRRESSSPAPIRVRRLHLNLSRLRMIAGLAAGFALATGVAGMAAAYVDYSYRRDPYQPLMTALANEGTPVLFTDSTMYLKLRPFLGARLPLIFAPDQPDDQLLRRLAGVLAGPRLALVFAGTDADRQPSSRLEQWLAGRLFPASEQWLENARIAWFVGGSPEPDQTIGTRFGGQVGLDAVAFDRSVAAGQPARILLRWRALGRPSADYRVYLHAIDSNGAVASQSDGPPQLGARPTSVWQTGESVDDRRTLALTNSGEYRLRVGLYDSAGVRLPVDGGGDGIDLGSIRVAQ